jgi:hypothetical protein
MRTSSPRSPATRAPSVSGTHAHNPEDLYGEAEELVQARKDIEAWRAADLGFLTFLDDDYTRCTRPPGPLQDDPVLLRRTGSRPSRPTPAGPTRRRTAR